MKICRILPWISSKSGNFQTMQGTDLKLVLQSISFVGVIQKGVKLIYLSLLVLEFSLWNLHSKSRKGHTHIIVKKREVIRKTDSIFEISVQSTPAIVSVFRYSCWLVLSYVEMVIVDGNQPGFIIIYSLLHTFKHPRADWRMFCKSSHVNSSHSLIRVCDYSKISIRFGRRIDNTAQQFFSKSLVNEIFLLILTDFDLLNSNLKTV